jgi:hypothetical protein
MLVKKKVIKVKKKKPKLNELILGVYLESLVKSLKEGKEPDKMYERVKSMISEYQDYKLSK